MLDLKIIGYAEEDARRGEVRRSLEQVGDLERMPTRLRSELKEALAGQRQFPNVPRWTGEKRPGNSRDPFAASVWHGSLAQRFSLKYGRRFCMMSIAVPVRRPAF